MADQQDNKIVAPEGITLDDPGSIGDAPSNVAVPEGITRATPANPPGSGVFLNPGGDVTPAGGATQTPPTPPPQRSATDFVLNQLPRSAGDFISNTLGALRHPIDTVEGLAKLASGGVQAAGRAAGIEIPENEYDQVARAFAHYAVNRYGGADKIKDALYTDPVGVMSDFSMLAGGVGGVADLANAGKVAEAMGALSKATNPAFLVTKPFSAAVGHFAPKLPGAFDPSTAEFGEATGAPATSAAPAAAAIPDLQEAIRQRAYDLAKQRQGEGVVPGRDEWLQAEQDVRTKPPKAPEAPEVAVAAPKPADAAESKLRQLVKTGLGAAGMTYGLDLLTHHIVGSIVGGTLATAAIKAIPELLRSPAGQEMLARIGPNSTPAAIAGVARDMVPALNLIHKSQQQPINLSGSPFLRAKGGPSPSSELARIQNERLGLRPRSVQILQRP